MKPDERVYWLAFSVFPGIGPKRFGELLHHFGNAKEAWHAPGPRLGKLLGEKLAEKLDKFRTGFSVEAYARRLQRIGVSFITFNDEQYPKLLKQIENPPYVIYIKGIHYNDTYHYSDKIIAIVGTRKVTSYGREVTQLLTQQLVDAGFTIVSGLAMGVDAIAHKTTIDNGGKTIAVLGSGVDVCYPTSNKWLYDSLIKENGCIVSEYPIGQKPSKGSFPSRNRIIAGLSQAVLVTEGAEDSGALITAKYALEFGRKVFAVPGPITSSLSKGPNELINKGAKLVISATDILKELGVENYELKIKGRKIKGETEGEQVIIDILQNEALQFDEIVRRSRFESSQVGTLLSLLEIKGFVAADGVGLYKITA